MRRATLKKGAKADSAHQPCCKVQITHLSSWSLLINKDISHMNLFLDSRANLNQLRGIQILKIQHNIVMSTIKVLFKWPLH